MAWADTTAALYRAVLTLKPFQRVNHFPPGAQPRGWGCFQAVSLRFWTSDTLPVHVGEGLEALLLLKHQLKLECERVHNLLLPLLETDLEKDWTCMGGAV